MFETNAQCDERIERTVAAGEARYAAALHATENEPIPWWEREDDDIFAETGSHGPTCSCDECQEKDAAGYWDNDDTIAHCTSCEENPATDDDAADLREHYGIDIA